MSPDDHAVPGPARAGFLRGMSRRSRGLNALAIRWFPSLAIVAAIFAAWEGYVRIFDVQRWLLPAPSVVARTIGDNPGLLARHTLVTVEEILIGFAVALCAGVALAVAIALSRALERAIYPFLIASQTIPFIVIAPLLLIWVGYGLAPKIIVVAFISFFPIVVNAVDGLRSVDPATVDLMRTLGAGRWQIFRKVQWPAAMPFLFTGTRIAIAASVIGAVIAEWMGSSEGLGYLMIRSKPQFLTERVFAAIAILSAMGIGLFVLVGAVERLAIPWWHSERGQRALEQE